MSETPRRPPSPPTVPTVAPPAPPRAPPRAPPHATSERADGLVTGLIVTIVVFSLLTPALLLLYGCHRYTARCKKRRDAAAHQTQAIDDDSDDDSVRTPVYAGRSQAWRDATSMPRSSPALRAPAAAEATEAPVEAATAGALASQAASKRQLLYEMAAQSVSASRAAAADPLPPYDTLRPLGVHIT